MRHPILSTGLMWSTASDLARFNLAFTKALNSGHSLIDQQLAEQLSIPSSTAERSLGFELPRPKPRRRRQSKGLLPVPIPGTDIPQYNFIKAAVSAFPSSVLMEITLAKLVSS